MTKRFLIELELCESISDGTEVIFLKKFYEMTSREDILEVLDKGHKVIKEFVDNKLNMIKG